jgi:ATP-dependent Clp protease protease subunit
VKNRLNNRIRGTGYRIEAKEKEADIFLYDMIDSFWGIGAKQFVKDLNAIKADTINLRINSPGGDVFDGTTIFNALRNHKAHVISHIDGLAASMASVIALAGDEVRMAENAMMMIHDPSTIVWGTAEDMRKTAELLDKIRDNLAQTYVDKTGESMDYIRDLMADETWFSAEEALDIGLVDEVTGKTDTKACFDLSKFKNVPEAMKDLPSETLDKRALESALRDAGCSRRQAAAILSGGFDTIHQRDADDGSANKSTADAIEAVTKQIKSLLPK